MRVLFLSDPLFAQYEREMIARLGIGLADEGFVVAWAVPERMAETINEQVLMPVIPYMERRLGLTPARRAGTLHRRALEVLGGTPDLVHLFGGGVARLGAETTRLSDALPAFEVWRPGLEASIRQAINRIAFDTHHESEGARALLVTPTDEARERLQKEFPEAIVRSIPWGVHPSRGDEDLTRETVCIVLLGPGRDYRSWQAAFRSAVRFLRGNERVHLFADAAATRRLRAWPIARKAGVLDRLSLIDEATATRELMLRADLVLQPDARGENRTIILEAMASGAAVIAAADPRSDLLIDGTTARLVVDQTEQQWYEALETLVNEGGIRRQLVSRAREHVASKHKASRQIASLIDAYEWVAGVEETIEPLTERT